MYRRIELLILVLVLCISVGGLTSWGLTPGRDAYHQVLSCAAGLWKKLQAKDNRVQ